MGASQSELEKFEDPGPGVTRERLARAVRQMEATEDVTIKTWQELGEMARGQGFMSTLTRVRVSAVVKGKIKNYNWVVKSLPRDLNRYSFLILFHFNSKRLLLQRLYKR